MGEGFVEKTQNTLGKVIQRPTLSEKNLSRPPFRFIHDIVTQLIRKTGFFKGLFPPEMLDSKNVTEKEQKVTFLQGIIACTTIIYGKEISVKASSIVAGKEPENTNKLLQIIGKLILEKKSSDEAVETLKNKSSGKGDVTDENTGKLENTEKKVKEKEKSKDIDERRRSKRDDDVKKDRSESKSKKEKQSAEKSDKRETINAENRNHTGGDNEAKNSEIKKRDSKKDTDTKKERNDSKRDRSERRAKETPEEREKRKDAEREERRRQRKLEKSGRPPRPTSAKGERRTAHVTEEHSAPEAPPPDNIPLADAPKKLRERPTSARPAKRVKALNVEEPAPIVNPNVIIDDANDEDEDNEIGFQDQIEPAKNISVDIGDTEEHGALVRDIIDSKRSHEKEVRNKPRHVFSKADQEHSRKETEKLQGEIQQISRTTAPIGRVLDFIQEDMDSMQSEFDIWSAELAKNQSLLNRGVQKNDASLQSIYDNLDELDSEIIKKRNEINATKQKIYINNNLIDKQVKMMLT